MLQNWNRHVKWSNCNFPEFNKLMYLINIPKQLKIVNIHFIVSSIQFGTGEKQTLHEKCTKVNKKKVFPHLQNKMEWIKRLLSVIAKISFCSLFTSCHTMQNQLTSYLFQPPHQSSFTMPLFSTDVATNNRK